MKRWGSYTIFPLWSLAAVSGIMVTSTLTTMASATTYDFHPDQLRSVKPESRMLARTDGVLILGSNDAAVKELQAMLVLMGYYSGSVDGTYGQTTLVAVRQFQADAGLEPDGVVGPATWRRLLPTPAVLTEPQESLSSEPLPSGVVDAPSTETPNIGPPSNVATSGTAGELQVLRLDDYGADVNKLQRRLSELDFYRGPIDGVFGLQTEQAVENFQRQAGLGVDGVVGVATWQELLR